MTLTTTYTSRPAHGALELRMLNAMAFCTALIDTHWGCSEVQAEDSTSAWMDLAWD